MNSYDKILRDVTPTGANEIELDNRVFPGSDRWRKFYIVSFKFYKVPL